MNKSPLGTIVAAGTVLLLSGLAQATPFGQIKVGGLRYQVKRQRTHCGARQLSIGGMTVVGNNTLLLDSHTAPRLVERFGGKIETMTPAPGNKFLVNYSLRSPGSDSLLRRVGRIVSRGPRHGRVPASVGASESFTLGTPGRPDGHIQTINVQLRVLTGAAALQHQYAKTGWRRHPERSFQAWSQMPAGSY